MSQLPLWLFTNLWFVVNLTKQRRFYSHMKKSFILIPMAALFLAGCGTSSVAPGSNPPGGGGDSSFSKVVYSFASLSGEGGKSYEVLAADAKALFEGCVTSGTSIISEVTDSAKMFNGNGLGGAHVDEFGLLKFGTTSANGTLTLSLTHEVSKVTVNCHDFYASSDAYPVNTNSLAVNSDSKLLPYNETGAGTDVVWTVSKTKTLNFEFSNSESGKGGRGVVFSITLEA